MMANLMLMMNETMAKQQESLLKILEDRDVSNRRNEMVTENVVVLDRGCTQEIEQAFDSSECEEGQKVRFGSQMLSGLALTWWNVTKSTLAPMILAQLTWTSFKGKVMEKF
ncbi:hypothetical protein L6452_08934 [Arctium lappa]|uniref:Uncharacterized protein n=1 Tax=Arctium lappa TaxID=4217 RepID=A0ACB9DJA4_ARCLA|nr:hypothetical protein L6452_08934 [Arctium lappa]